MKKNIIIDKTKITIENYGFNENINFQRSLQVYDKVYHRVDKELFKYNREEQKMTIPGGYNIELLEEYFRGSNIINKRNEEYPYRTISFSLKYPARDSIQNKAIKFLITKKSPQKFLCLETGKGKTYCSIHYVFKIKKTPITFVDQLDIGEQWKDKILTFTDIKEDEIYLISGTDSINKLLNMNDEDINKYKWFIGMHRTFSQYEKEEDITNLLTKLGIGIRLYDEAHVEMESIFKIDRLYQCESVYITATPKRSNYLENIVYKNMFSVNSVPKFYCKGDNYHNVIIYKYDSKPTLTEEASMLTQYGFNGNAYCKYLLREDKIDEFVDRVKDILRFLNKNIVKKSIILFKTIELCDYMYEELKQICEEEFNCTIGVYHSNKKDKKEELTKDIIVTTDKSFGKAKDLPGLEVCINTVPCSSETHLTQIKGRLREIPDREVFVIDMVDVGFERQEKQLLKRMTVYRKSSKNIFSIDKTK